MKKLILPLIAAFFPMGLSAQIVINEVLYDPAFGNDVNGDTFADASDDEFVEIVNTGAVPVEIGGYTITDLTGNTFGFPVGTMLGGNEAVLVFGGGNPAATLNGAAVYIGAPSLNNGGDTITLFDSEANQVDQVVWTSSGTASDQSYNRSPDLFGDFAPHTTIAGSVGTESPGTASNGGAFNFSVSTLFLSPESVSIIESGAGNTAELTVTLAETPASYPVTINLSSSDLSEATVPASFEIASGLTGTFTVTGVDDTAADGDQTVTITASSSAFLPDSLALTVRDDGDIAVPSTSPLLITQYYEGDFGNNKFIELTNTSDSELDLNGYIVGLFFNASAEEFRNEGATPGNQEPLSGTLAAGASYVIANSQSTTPLSAESADITSTVTFFNGNDSIVLYSGATISPSTIADALSCTENGFEGSNTSFVRQNADLGFSMSAGSSVLDFSNVWLSVPLEEVNAAILGEDIFLGSSALGVNSPLVAFSVTSATANEADGTIDLVVEILNPDGNAVTVDLVFDAGNSTASLGDLGNYATQMLRFPAGAASGESQTVTVTLTDDSEEETGETAIFTLSNLVTAGGARVGGASSFNLSLQDNDTVIPPVYISEIADPQDNFEARYVELFNPTSEAIDLAAGNWNIVYYVNGNSSGNSIPLLGTIPAGGTYVIANNIGNFSAAYPEARIPEQEDSDINSNGDDNIELRFGGGEGVGALVDLYGMPGTDGTGQVWEFLDSRVDRIVGAPNATFTIEEWLITPATVADMTPGVFGGGGPVAGVEPEVIGFSIDPEAGRATLTVTGLGTKIWVIQFSDDLGFGDAWEEIASGFTETDNPDGSVNLLFFDSFGSVPKRFYRLIEQR
jgi:hypothetical protein